MATIDAAPSAEAINAPRVLPVHVTWNTSYDSTAPVEGPVPPAPRRSPLLVLVLDNAHIILTGVVFLLGLYMITRGRVALGVLGLFMIAGTVMAAFIYITRNYYTLSKQDVERFLDRYFSPPNQSEAKPNVEMLAISDAYTLVGNLLERLDDKRAMLKRTLPAEQHQAVDDWYTALKHWETDMATRHTKKQN